VAAGLLFGYGDQSRVLVLGERKELSSPAAREQRPGVRAHLPAHVLAVTVEVEHPRLVEA
jgi:hypothetical protein